jgi:hypothetical protein
VHSHEQGDNKRGLRQDGEGAREVEIAPLSTPLLNNLDGIGQLSQLGVISCV